MRTTNQNIKASVLLMIGALIPFITGCASPRSKLEAFNKAKKNTDFIYAQVNKVSPGSSLKKDCEHINNPKELKAFKMKVCDRLNDFNVVNWSVLTYQEIINRSEVVPVTVNLKVGSIVKLHANAEAGFHFAEVAAYEETETCKWVGSDNDLADGKLTTTGKVVSGFLLGAFLTIPTIGYLVSDRQGGVECNGWSYKTAYADFLK